MRKSFFLLLLLTLTSCSDKPRHEKFPGPPGRTTEFQQAQTTKEVLGGFDPTRSQVDDEKSIRGIVKVKPGLSLPKKKYTIFISAKTLDGGPPLAVTRMNPRSFPFRFSLTQDNVMIQGNKLEGFVEVVVRLVQVNDDGSVDPLSRQAGDIMGSKRLRVGAKDVEILIDQASQ